MGSEMCIRDSASGGAKYRKMETTQGDCSALVAEAGSYFDRVIGAIS